MGIIIIIDIGVRTMMFSNALVALKLSGCITKLYYVGIQYIV